MTAFLGASTAYIESTLAQIYKEKDDNGLYRGGPAYYIEKGMGQKWYAWTFAVATVLATGLLLPGVQANGIAMSMQTAFGVEPMLSAAAIALTLGFIIFGGVRRIANFAEFVVPFMALGYIAVACFSHMANQIKRGTGALEHAGPLEGHQCCDHFENGHVNAKREHFQCMQHAGVS